MKASRGSKGIVVELHVKNDLRILTSGDRDTMKFGNYSFGAVGVEDEVFLLSFRRIESAYFCSMECQF